MAASRMNHGIAFIGIDSVVRLTRMKARNPRPVPENKKKLITSGARPMPVNFVIMMLILAKPTVAMKDAMSQFKIDPPVWFVINIS